MKNLLLIHFENGNHFNFLKIKKNEKISDININNNVTVNKFTYKFSNSLCINEIANNNKYVVLKIIKIIMMIYLIIYILKKLILIMKIK